MSGRVADAKVYLSTRHPVCWAACTYNDSSVYSCKDRVSVTTTKKPSGGWALSIIFQSYVPPPLYKRL